MLRKPFALKPVPTLLKICKTTFYANDGAISEAYKGWLCPSELDSLSNLIPLH